MQKIENIVVQKPNTKTINTKYQKVNIEQQIINNK